MAIHNVYKPLSWTPLQAIERLRELQPELNDEPIVYAGRLDPMAEGILILLSGDDRFRLDEFLSLDKTYEAQFLFGLQSDSYDVLGILEIYPTLRQAQGISESLLGLHTLPFPPYSSYKVQGKPLHWWTKEGRLNEIDIPMKEMEVKGVKELKEVKELKVLDIRSEIIDRIANVQGDFRQDQIIDSWERLEEDKKISLMSVSLEVTSGTYIRSLANDIGGMLYTLKRTKVGSFDIMDSIKLDHADR